MCVEGKDREEYCGGEKDQNTKPNWLVMKVHFLSYPLFSPSIIAYYIITNMIFKYI